MPAVDPVILQLRAEMKDYQNQLKSTTVLVNNQLDRQERSFLELEHQVNRTSTRVGNAVGAMGRSVAGFVSGFALGAVIRELAQMADRAKQLDAQLRLATSGFGSYGQAQKDVARIASDTRSSLGATANLYGNFARASKETGRSQEEAARATETFSKALKIGGADANSAASATLQFGQALASGTLRGDEFNSIMEASPRLARLLAEALGVPIGQLRKMAEEGKITSDVLFRALTDKRFTAGIDADFKNLPVTFGDALQQIENQALQTFGEFDKGGRFSDALVALLGTGTDTFDGLTSKARQFGIDTRAIFDGLANVFDPMSVNGSAVLDALGIKLYSLREQIASVLGSFDNAYNLYARADNFGTNIENSIKRGFNEAMRRAGAKKGDPNYREFRETPLIPLARNRENFLQGNRRSQARGHHEAAAARLESLGYIVPRNADGTVNEAGIVKPTKSTPARRPSPVATGGAGKKSAGGSKAKSAASDAANAADDLALYLRRFSISTDDVEVPTRSDREASAARSVENIFGTEGRDYDNPFASVAENDKLRAAYFDAISEAEKQAQDVRERNIYQLADTFETLFQEGTDGVWRNFKDQGLRAIAQIAAQALATSFGKGGGGFDSLLGNIGTAASTLFSGGKLFGRASGGYVGPGQMVRVNEQRPGVELLRMGAQGGTVIPLGQAAAARSSGGVTLHQTVNIDASGMNPDGYTANIVGIMRRETAQAIASNNGAIRKTFPAAQDRFAKLGTTG